MAVRKFKPVTAGTRHKIIGTFEEITCSVPEKSLLSPKKSSGGRNNSGKMTVRYIGGGHKQMYRLVDFKRSKDGIPATVKTIEYDPNRTARIALLVYADGEKSYIIAPNGLQVGQTVVSGPGVAPEVGNTLPCRIFRWVRWSTTSNSTPVRVPPWLVRPVRMLSFWHARASSPSSSCLPVRLVWCSLLAARRWVWCRTSTTTSKAPVRQVVNAGSAVARATAVSL